MSQEVLGGIFYCFGNSWRECVFCLFFGKILRSKKSSAFFFKEIWIWKSDQKWHYGESGGGGAAAHFWIDLIDKWTLTWLRVVFPNYFPEYRYFCSYLRMNAIGLVFTINNIEVISLFSYWKLFHKKSWEGKLSRFMKSTNYDPRIKRHQEFLYPLPCLWKPETKKPWNRKAQLNKKWKS